VCYAVQKLISAVEGTRFGYLGLRLRKLTFGASHGRIGSVMSQCL